MITKNEARNQREREKRKVRRQAGQTKPQKKYQPESTKLDNYILSLFRQQNGFAEYSEIENYLNKELRLVVSKGMIYHGVQALLRSGRIEKLARGFYKLKEVI